MTGKQHHIMELLYSFSKFYYLYTYLIKIYLEFYINNLNFNTFQMKWVSLVSSIKTFSSLFYFFYHWLSFFITFEMKIFYFYTLSNNFDLYNKKTEIYQQKYIKIIIKKRKKWMIYEYQAWISESNMGMRLVFSFSFFNAFLSVMKYKL